MAASGPVADLAHDDRVAVAVALELELELDLPAVLLPPVGMVTSLAVDLRELQLSIGGTDKDFEPPEEPFLAEELVAPRPWIAETHRRHPFDVADAQRDRDGASEQVLAPDPYRLGLDVADVEADVVRDPAREPVVEGAGIAESNEVGCGVVRDHEVNDGARSEPVRSGQASEGEDHQANPPTSREGSSGTWKITPTRPIA